MGTLMSLPDYLNVRSKIGIAFRWPFLLLAYGFLWVFVPDNSFAGDSTTISHPSSSTWHVKNADLSNEANYLNPSAVPDCGPSGALTDLGNGFACMTPAKGDPGSAGAPGSAGPQGPSGGGGGGLNAIAGSLWACQTRGMCPGVPYGFNCAIGTAPANPQWGQGTDTLFTLYKIIAMPANNLNPHVLKYYYISGSVTYSFVWNYDTGIWTPIQDINNGGNLSGPMLSCFAGNDPNTANGGTW